MMDIIGWIGAILGIIGAVLNARLSILGFYIWIASNALMVVVGYYTPSKLAAHNYYSMTLFSVYFIISVYGLITWRKKKPV